MFGLVLTGEDMEGAVQVCEASPYEVLTKVDPHPPPTARLRQK